MCWDCHPPAAQCELCARLEMAPANNQFRPYHWDQTLHGNISAKLKLRGRHYQQIEKFLANINIRHRRQSFSMVFISLCLTFSYPYAMNEQRKLFRAAKQDGI